ncbi:hypothetical protein MMC25_003845 [Agyrium rufum]|nr:hypothetical protein [Agyrium rufum]
MSNRLDEREDVKSSSKASWEDNTSPSGDDDASNIGVLQEVSKLPQELKDMILLELFKILFCKGKVFPYEIAKCNVGWYFGEVDFADGLINGYEYIPPDRDLLFRLPKKWHDVVGELLLGGNTWVIGAASEAPPLLLEELLESQLARIRSVEIRLTDDDIDYVYNSRDAEWEGVSFTSAEWIEIANYWEGAPTAWREKLAAISTLDLRFICLDASDAHEQDEMEFNPCVAECIRSIAQTHMSRKHPPRLEVRVRNEEARKIVESVFEEVLTDTGHIKTVTICTCGTDFEPHRPKKE